MSSFAGSLTALFIAGMVGGYAGLCLLGPTDETQTMAVAAAAPIPDPPALPCSMQAWPNADRKCLDWTAPRAEVAQARAEAKPEAKTDGAQKAVATAPAPDKRATPAAQPSMGGANVAATQPAAEAAADAPAARADAPAKAAAAKSRSAAHANKTKALAVMRGFGDNLNDVRLNAYAPDGSSRRSATRSVQDRSYGARPGGWWW
jgi:hypothetical protein